MAKMSKLRKNLWIGAIVFFFIADLITTYFGMSHPSIIEQNGLMREYFNKDNFMALFLFKFWWLGIFYVIDNLLIDYLGDLALPVVPIFLFWDGLEVTLHNLGVLQNAGFSPLLVLLVIGVVSLITIEFITNKTNTFETWE